jgi:hypothetical protein
MEQDFGSHVVDFLLGDVVVSSTGPLVNMQFSGAGSAIPLPVSPYASPPLSGSGRNILTYFWNGTNYTAASAGLASFSSLFALPWSAQCDKVRFTSSCFLNSSSTNNPRLEATFIGLLQGANITP